MADTKAGSDDRLSALIAQRAAPILKGLMGHGGISLRGRYTPFEKMFSYVEITRPFLLAMAPPITGAGAILANGKMPHITPVLLGSLAACLATAGIHTFNDWWDRRRDSEAWPDRPMPTMRIPPAAGLAYAVVLAVASLLLVWSVFNPLATVVLGAGILLGLVYTICLRDAVGYLSLPFIIAIFPVGGWAAFSPATLFRSRTPWILALTAVVWQAGHIMVHSSSHPLRTTGERLVTQKKAMFFYPSPRSAAWMGFCFTLATFLMSVALMLLVDLGWFYAVVAFPVGVMAVFSAIVLIGEPASKPRSMVAFNVASLNLIFVFGAIVLDVFFRKSLSDYLTGISRLLAALGEFTLYRLEGLTAFFYVAGGAVCVAVTLLTVVILSRLLAKTVRM